MFEITIVMRDMNGDPILDEWGNPRKKNYVTDTGSKLQDIWYKNSNVARSPKKKKRRKGKAANKTQVKEAIQEVDSYIEKINRKKKEKFDDER